MGSLSIRTEALYRWLALRSNPSMWLVDRVGSIAWSSCDPDTPVGPDSLRVCQGVLSLHSPAASQRLRAKLAAAIDTRQASAMTQPLNVGRCDRLLLIRIAAAPLNVCGLSAAPSPLALVSVTSSATSAIEDAVLRDLFGLTPAESALAIALWQGRSVDGHARARGVQASTVRTQLQMLLRKTWCRRQQDLLCLLSRVP